ncbi:hypothetical protein [Tessaracoccus rhinocerotis]|uniref:hypothetical protein n=1 Tax=Tessaracoccus rhinocerotis TaxID=1689449 RepID=UPI0011807815|nr:hypothetical protein [Tessaracoccus rhinocerotis]
MTASRIAVARTYQLLTHATDLILEGRGVQIDSLTALAIGSLELRVFALLEPSNPLPHAGLPDSVVESVGSAADQTSDWDHAQLPAEAVEVSVTLREVAEALSARWVLP